MPAINFKQGEDLIVEIAILDDSNVNVDLTTKSFIRAILYTTKGNVRSVQREYNSIVKQGFGVCRVKAGTGNEHILQILIRREDSSKFQDGTLSFVVLTTDEPTTDFPSGITKEFFFDSYGTVSVGIGKDEIVP